MFQNKTFLGRENFIKKERLSEYKIGLCPNAEKLQPKCFSSKQTIGI